MQPSICALGHYLREMKTLCLCSQNLSTNVYSSFICNGQKLGTTQISSVTEGWVVDYYSAIKMNELLIHAITYMNIQGIILSKEGQSQKATYHIIPFM